MTSSDKEAADAMARDWTRDHDRLTAERDVAYQSLARIHTWLGRAIENGVTDALVEDAYNEAAELVRIGGEEPTP